MFQKYLLRKLLLKYCKNTSLHGFIYVHKEKYCVSKIFWFFTCISCSVFSVYLMYIQLERYNSNVITTELKTNIYPIWTNPFPAVTICNYNVVHLEKTQYFTNILSSHNFTIDDIKSFFENLKRLAFHEGENNSLFDLYEEMLNVLKDHGYDVTKLMMNLAQSCDDMLRKCEWLSKEYECKHLFNMIKTNMGFCCSFNYYGSNQIQQILKGRTELHYAAGAGVNFGLRLEIDIEDSQYVTNHTQKGVKVFVHPNGAYPDLFLLSYLLESSYYLTLSLSSSILISNSNVKNIRIDQRSCLMEDENILSSTNVYDFQTCLIECKMNYIHKLCGCVPYFSPIYENQTCTFKNLHCLLDNEVRLANLALKIDKNQEENKKFTERLSDNALDCFCLPNCNEIIVNTFAEKFPTDNLTKNTSILNVYYNSIEMLKTERSFSFSWDMLFASFGGIFGLALGGSVFNLLEVVYFVFCSVYGKWKVENELKYKSSKTSVNRNGKIKLFVVYKQYDYYN